MRVLEDITAGRLNPSPPNELHTPGIDFLNRRTLITTMADAEFSFTEARLTSNHTWKARPGHKILVLDRGAVRLEYPEAWVVLPTEDCIKVHDKEPPDDDCVLGVSYHRWPSIVAPELSVGALLQKAFDGDPRSFYAFDPIVEQERMDLRLAWREGRFIDAATRRNACGRLCIARQGNIQVLITFDFWLSDLQHCDAVWRSVLASLRIGEWIADPRAGPVLS
jgi:hypothetical protein